jgi:hypothetical protein
VAGARIDAAGFDTRSGTRTEAGSDGGDNVSGIGNGDWLTLGS